ncbi:MAG TPA: glycosyltransferase, partial [Ancylobacter sp.]
MNLHRAIIDRPSEHPAEIAGLLGRLDSTALADAAMRAEKLDVGADEVLIATHLASPDEIARAAASHLGIAFVPLDGPVAVETGMYPAHRTLKALLHTGMMRCADGRLLVAARGKQLRVLAEHIAQRPEIVGRIGLTTPERLAAHVKRRFGTQLARHAAFNLCRTLPTLSAAGLGMSRYVLAGIALALVLMPLAMYAVPSMAMVAPALVLAAVLLGWSVLRLTACTLPPQREPPLSRDDATLPAYSLLVPLYREARVVPQLIAAISTLDYPREKLQILLVVEPDDIETTAALRRHIAHSCFEIIVATPLGPRTKPKALNAALSFARGEFIGVYDAEDVPDPLQLRRACAVFRRRDNSDIACVQARLAIDNLADNWITRQFAAEYAGHFDVVLPMLAAFRLPIPLGGTSNHFRRKVLEEIGGWDPYNVTEDADLGIRLARGGWRTVVIASTTDEEAPRTARAWMCQRTRWYKGWLQTLLVHGRHPGRLVRQIGWIGTATLTVMLGGSLAAALMHPFFVATLLLGWWMDYG